RSQPGRIAASGGDFGVPLGGSSQPPQPSQIRAIALLLGICSAGGMKPGRREPDLIIFDCDGVLVDSEMLSCRCLCEVLATYGIKLELAEALELFLGRSTAAVLQHYAAHGRALPNDFLSD